MHQGNRYNFIKNNAGALYSVNQKIKSHFFTITGIYKIYEDGKYDTYCRICSWGEEYYIKLVSFEKRLVTLVIS